MAFPSSKLLLRNSAVLTKAWFFSQIREKSRRCESLSAREGDAGFGEGWNKEGVCLSWIKHWPSPGAHRSLRAGSWVPSRPHLGVRDPSSPSQPLLIHEGIIRQSPNLPPLCIPEEPHELPTPPQTLSTGRDEESRPSQIFLQGGSLCPAAKKNDCSNPLPARRIVQEEKGMG